MTKPNQIQGEGNYEAAKEYDEAQRKFVKSGKVDAAARTQADIRGGSQGNAAC